MSSPRRPIDPAQFDIMFWLPPGGVGNRRAGNRRWVDSLQYHRPEDLLMPYLRGSRRSGTTP